MSQRSIMVGRTKNGFITTAEYNSWHCLKSRCLNPNDKRFHDYGGRGITVCEDWYVFENFLRDMGRKPTESHSIDRIDNDKGYCKDNCRWATKEEQQRNIRVQKNNKIGVKGVCWDKTKRKYKAQLYANGKFVLRKRFDTLEEAIQARKEAEEKYWTTSH